jgi:hypothetical protein
MVSRLAAGIACTFCATAATLPVTDEAIRLQTLAAIFPGTMVTVAVDRAIDSSHRSADPRRLVTFPDALAKEKVYRVTGAPANEVERCAAAGKSTGQREARLRVYAWPPNGKDGVLLAVVQYAFQGPDPDSSCASIALIVRLLLAGQRLEVAERFLLDTGKHEGLQNVQLVDLSGDGIDELVVESDFGEKDASGSTIQIFDLSHGKLEQVLEHASRMYAKVMGEELYKQELDIPRTLKTQGKQFCFTRTVYGEEGKWYPSPKVTRPCYDRGRGVDAEENQKRQEHLK